MDKPDLSELRGMVTDVLEEALQDILQGAKDDLRQFALDISRDVVAAAARGDKKLLVELGAQVEMIGELNRLRLVNAGWDTVNRIILTSGTFALRLLA